LLLSDDFDKSSEAACVDPLISAIFGAGDRDSGAGVPGLDEDFSVDRVTLSACVSAFSVIRSRSAFAASSISPSSTSPTELAGFEDPLLSLISLSFRTLSLKLTLP
jgi:hypothetical protein